MVDLECIYNESVKKKTNDFIQLELKNRIVGKQKSIIHPRLAKSSR